MLNIIHFQPQHYIILLWLEITCQNPIKCTIGATWLSPRGHFCLVMQQYKPPWIHNNRTSLLACAFFNPCLLQLWHTFEIPFACMQWKSSALLLSEPLVRILEVIKIWVLRKIESKKSSLRMLYAGFFFLGLQC